MKIYTRKDFMKLPEGTIFSKGREMYFDGLFVKGSSLHNDFMFIDLCVFDSDGSEDLLDKQEDALKQGSSYPINQDFMRDGCFDENDIFLVYEKEDIKVMQKHFQRAYELD